MKTLLILRHAKSSWKDTALSDHERPLNKRGKRDAPKMGRLLRDKKLVPRLIIGSSAERVRETINYVCEACGYQGEIVYDDTLYLGEPQDYIRCLNAADDIYDRVMVVGHNPGLEELVELLCAEEYGMPTATLAEVRLPIKSWSELSGSVDGQCLHVWIPKALSV